MSQVATVPRGTVAALRHLPFWAKCHFLSNQKSSQDGKSLRVANVSGRQMSPGGHLPLWDICLSGTNATFNQSQKSCVRMANVLEWQMSRGGKCPRVAKVPEWQMSQDGKCHRWQKSGGKNTIFWVLVESGICLRKANVQSGKCHRRQMSQGGKWKRAFWDKGAKSRRQMRNGIRESGIWNRSGTSEPAITKG